MGGIVTTEVNKCTRPGNERPNAQPRWPPNMADPPPNPVPANYTFPLALAIPTVTIVPPMCLVPSGTTAVYTNTSECPPLGTAVRQMMPPMCLIPPGTTAAYTNTSERPPLGTAVRQMMPPTTTSPAHLTEWSPPLIAPGISDRNLSNAVLAGKVTNIMTGGARPKVKRMKKQSAAALPTTPTSDAMAEATPDVNHQQLLHEKARLLDHRDRILKSHEREATDQMHQIATLKSIAVKYENNIATLNDELRLLKLANQSNDIPTHSGDKCKHGGQNKVQRDCMDDLPSCHQDHYRRCQHLPTCPHCHMPAYTQRSEHNTDSSLSLRMLEGLARLEAKIDMMTIYGKNHQYVIPTPTPTPPYTTTASDDGNSITPNVTQDRPMKNSHMNFRYAENI